MQAKANTRYAIQSVESALDVLEAICEVEGDVTIAHLSQKLSMNKSTVFRLLATFENRGYVERARVSGRYKVGLSACEIARKLLLRMDLWRKGKPIMSELARECGETVYLAVPRRQEILLLDMVETSQQVLIMPMVGRTFPLEQISAGKVILAHRNMTGVDQAWQKIRNQGACLDRDALGEGATSLSVPVFNAQRDVAGSLCLVGPSFRLTEERIAGVLLPHLQEAGQALSSKLGYLDDSLWQ